jgi:glycosyltransferase involved in cell wall biosynthesis
LQFVNNLITTKAIAVSPALVSQVAASGVKLDKISVIYNGCEDMIKYSPKFCNENERSMTVLYHGRVTKEKGLDCAVKAIRILSDNNVDVRLTIVGDGEYKRELEAYSEALDVRNNIKFLPYIEDIKECINTSDVILNASLFAEGTSNSVIEGMSAKRAVILSDVEGNVCLSSNGKYGVLFNKGDAQDLSRAIMQIYENKSEYKKMSDAARMGYEEHYTLKRMTDEYEKVWEREYEKRYKD